MECDQPKINRLLLVVMARRVANQLGATAKTKATRFARLKCIKQLSITNSNAHGLNVVVNVNPETNKS